jgi:hypothetical protein
MMRLLSRWAEASTQARISKLEADLEAERLKVKVIEAERDNLASVVARDRERIRAEGAAYARQRADSEGVPDGKRTV